MNMTKKFVHDRKDHTDEHERWNLTENVSQQRTLTGEYDQNKLIQSYSTIQVCRPNEFKPL